MTFALIYASVSLFCVSIMFTLCAFARIGYETEDGFFYGEPSTENQDAAAIGWAGICAAAAWWLA